MNAMESLKNLKWIGFGWMMERISRPFSVVNPVRMTNAKTCWSSGSTERASNTFVPLYKPCCLSLVMENKRDSPAESPSLSTAVLDIGKLSPVRELSFTMQRPVSNTASQVISKPLCGITKTSPGTKYFESNWITSIFLRSTFTTVESPTISWNFFMWFLVS